MLTFRSLAIFSALALSSGEILIWIRSVLVMSCQYVCKYNISMLTRRVTFRLYPKPAQEAQLFEWRRLHAYLYNSALANRKDSYQKRGETVDYFDQQNRLPAFKETWQEYRSRSNSRLDIFCQVNNPFFCIILERGRRRSSHQKALSALGSPCF